MQRTDGQVAAAAKGGAGAWIAMTLRPWGHLMIENTIMNVQKRQTSMQCLCHVSPGAMRIHSPSVGDIDAGLVHHWRTKCLGQHRDKEIHNDIGCLQGLCRIIHSGISFGLAPRCEHFTYRDGWSGGLYIIAQWNAVAGSSQKLEERWITHIGLAIRRKMWTRRQRCNASNGYLRTRRFPPRYAVYRFYRLGRVWFQRHGRW